MPFSALSAISAVNHPPTHGRDARATAFTLIEMITVLTIIIIVLAIAIPVWNALMGGTNLAAAQNQISAFLSNARTDAIYNRQTIGVFFFIDPKTQQTAMAEVQVQTLCQPHPYPADNTTYNTSTNLPPYSSTFQPESWPSISNWAQNATANTYPPSPAAANYTNDNGPVNSIELVNNPDPNTPGNFVFYRDVVLLPKGVGVALNNNTFTYNEYNQWGYNPVITNSTGNVGYPPLDRYMRLGAIFFAPDGTLTSIPFAIPLCECLTVTQYTNAKTNNAFPPQNLLGARIGMSGNIDLASNVYPPAMNSPYPPIHLPLMSSVGLVVYDHDAYLAQHATMQVNVGGTATNIGNNPPDQFTDWDMNYTLYTAAYPSGVYQSSAADKFIEESWIDQNGTAFLVSPNSGTLLKAK
jgi:type II secretory pathway pseudopilin PulG